MLPIGHAGLAEICRGLSHAAQFSRLYTAGLQHAGQQLPMVAIIGRPNVGKSAMFNRLVKRRSALVHNTPDGHVTRDYKEGPAQLADLKFTAVDTSGLEPFSAAGTIQARATALTGGVLQRAHVALFLLDARQGVTAQDEMLAQWLRVSQGASTVVLAANKAEAQGGRGAAEVSAGLADAARLGLGEAVAVSAETGEGMADLYEALQPHIDAHTQAMNAAADPDADAVGSGPAEAPSGMADSAAAEAAAADLLQQSDRDSDTAASQLNQQQQAWVSQTLPQPGPASSQEDRPPAQAEGQSRPTPPLRIAIMGLPNVGKSTLANRLLGHERSLTGPEPGLTRDAVHDSFEWGSQRVQLVDTAGWMRRTRLPNYDDSGGKVAAMTLQQGRQSMHLAAVVVLVVDCSHLLPNSSAEAPAGLSTPVSDGLGGSLPAALTRREVALAHDTLQEGRVLVVAANKLDVVPPELRKQVLQQMQTSVVQQLPDAAGLPVVGLSAASGLGLGRLLPAVERLHNAWNQRIPTSKLNAWSAKIAAKYAGTGATGRDLQRVRYLTQVKTRPPTFAAFVSGAAPFTESSRRLLVNALKEDLKFQAVPIRVEVRYRKRRKPKD